MTYSVVHDVANKHETPNDLVYVTVALKVQTFGATCILQTTCHLPTNATSFSTSVTDATSTSDIMSCNFG